MSPHSWPQNVGAVGLQMCRSPAQCAMLVRLTRGCTQPSACLLIPMRRVLKQARLCKMKMWSPLTWTLYSWPALRGMTGSQAAVGSLAGQLRKWAVVKSPAQAAAYQQPDQHYRTRHIAEGSGCAGQCTHALPGEAALSSLQHCYRCEVPAESIPGFLRCNAALSAAAVRTH